MSGHETIAELLRQYGTSVTPLRWEPGVLHLLDQRMLPGREIWLLCSSDTEVVHAIRDMVVRGAPAIGITATFGMVLSAREFQHKDRDVFIDSWSKAADRMLAARTTAVNLRWAVERQRACINRHAEADAAELADLMEKEALSVWEEDVRANIIMGAHGQALLPDTGGVLTHCNAGALATGGYGTALGVIRAAVASGKSIQVFADETRPWFQGSRLTAWELLRDKIPVTIIVDSAAGFLMQRGDISAVVVGADRIAANGDVANKIGTYSIAELAHANGISFLVVAPISTLDPATPSGDRIPIEERASDEVTSLFGQVIAAHGVSARNPVFDITPNRLITAIITERGVLTPPYGPAIDACFA
jgi:methylthioribose-1-phosphate isomerase